jgi:DNA end-binding protein Ku
MAVAHKSVISFGLVAIPIAMYMSTQDNDIHLNQLHKEDSERVRYKKTCAHCGKELAAGDIVKGYEYDKDRYVVITDEEIEKIKTEKERAIQILHFSKLDEISPIYYEKTYMAVPEPGGEKAFELLRSALMAEQKVAIGKTVIGTRDTLMAIIPRQDGVLISTMFFQDEVKELPKSYNKTEPQKAEMDMARLLINAMDTPFNPEEYHDEYQTKLRALIETKIAGREVTAPNPESMGNVINLMDALKASIQQTAELSATKKPSETKKPETKRQPKKEKEKVMA